MEWLIHTRLYITGSLQRAGLTLRAHDDYVQVKVVEVKVVRVTDAGNSAAEGATAQC